MRRVGNIGTIKCKRQRVIMAPSRRRPLQKSHTPHTVYSGVTKREITT